MGKICAVKQCRNRNSGVCKKSKVALFRTPKCPKRQKSWSNILGIPLTYSQFICARHFHDSDIQKADVFHLTNGVVESIPRLRWRLSPHALPKDIQNDEPEEDCKSESEPEEATATAVISKPYEVHKNCEMPGEPLHSATIKTEVKQEQVESCETLEENFLETIINDVKNEFETEEHDPLILQPQNRGTQILTLSPLEACLNEQLLPQGWSWIKKEEKLIFTFHDGDNFDAKIHIEIAEDLSAEIVTITGHRIPLDRVSSMAHVQLHFEKAEQLHLCSGTGIESEKRAPYCLGILNESEKYKIHRPVERCLRCRIHRQELNRSARRKITVAENQEPRTENRESEPRFKLVYVKTICNRPKNKKSSAASNISRNGKTYHCVRKC